MLRVILSLIVGGILLASVGFANMFNINSNPGQPGQQDISSGSALVGSCNSNVEVNIIGDGYVAPPVGDFVVASVWINANPDCATDKVTVQLTGAGGAALGAPVSGILDAVGDATLIFNPPQNIKVSLVMDVHVLIESMP